MLYRPYLTVRTEHRVFVLLEKQVTKRMKNL